MSVVDRMVSMNSFPDTTSKFIQILFVTDHMWIQQMINTFVGGHRQIKRRFQNQVDQCATTNIHRNPVDGIANIRHLLQSTSTCIDHHRCHLARVPDAILRVATDLTNTKHIPAHLNIKHSADTVIVRPTLTPQRHRRPTQMFAHIFTLTIPLRQSNVCSARQRLLVHHRQHTRSCRCHTRDEMHLFAIRPSQRQQMIHTDDRVLFEIFDRLIEVHLPRRMNDVSHLLVQFTIHFATLTQLAIASRSIDDGRMTRRGSFPSSALRSTFVSSCRCSTQRRLIVLRWTP